MLQNDSFLLWSLKCLCALPHTRDMALAHTQAMRKSILTPPVSVTGKIIFFISFFWYMMLIVKRLGLGLGLGLGTGHGDYLYFCTFCQISIST